jgi:hypothetical protein
VLLPCAAPANQSPTLRTAARPAATPRHPALALQRSAGNRATRALMASLHDPALVRQSAEQATRGPSKSLPYLEQIQRAFGRHDVRDVRAHLGRDATRGALGMGASAFAAGNQVAFAGRPDLHTAAHEAAHVVQQRGGVQLAGGVGRVGDRYERNADAVADAVTSGRSAESMLDAHAPSGDAAPGGAAPIQRLFFYQDRVYDQHDLLEVTSFGELKVKAIGYPLYRLAHPQQHDFSGLSQQRPLWAFYIDMLNHASIPGVWRYDPARGDWVNVAPLSAALSGDPHHEEISAARDLLAAIGAGKTKLAIADPEGFPGFKGAMLTALDWLLFIRRANGEIAGVRPRGFQLISELSRAQKKTLIRPAKFQELLETRAQASPSEPGATAKGEPSPSEVAVSPTIMHEPVQVLAAISRQLIDMPWHIAIGHELIHALHFTTGTAHLNDGSGGTIPEEYPNPEEYWTIEAGALSENALREEHGLPHRLGHWGAQPISYDFPSTLPAEGKFDPDEKL